MKRRQKYLAIFAILSLLLMPINDSYAIPADTPAETVTIKGISKVSISATRSTSSNAKIIATGPLTAKASLITTVATLYIFNSSTGSLTAANVSPVTKTASNCTSYKFSTTFAVDPAKVYKVKLEITDVTNGASNKIITYSNAF